MMEKNTEFSIATYLYDETQVAAWYSKVPHGDSFLASFTGVILLRDLATKELSRFTYLNGVEQKSDSQQSAEKVAAPSSIGATNATSARCVELFTCYWTGRCGSSGIVYGSTTSNIGYCKPPAMSSCGGGMAWRLSDQDRNLICAPDPAPPLPMSPTSVKIIVSGPKINPKQETRCFDALRGAMLTVYVQQANPGTRDKIGSFQVGHTFIGITQNGITRYMGYYPQSTANTALVAVGRSYPGELHDNSGTTYHVSITAPVGSSQLTGILNYINNYLATYNLNNYNCADFGIAVGNLGGMNLPATTTQSMTFGGRSPGDLGEDIRTMPPPANGSINQTGGNAPSKQGNCP